MHDKYRDRIKVDYAAGAAMYGGADVAGAAFATVDFSGYAGRRRPCGGIGYSDAGNGHRAILFDGDTNLYRHFAGPGLAEHPGKEFGGRAFGQDCGVAGVAENPKPQCCRGRHRHGGVLCGLCADGSISYFA